MKNSKKKSSAVLLDTNILISLIEKNSKKRQEIEDQLKLLALTCDEFLTTEEIALELDYLFDQRLKKGVNTPADYKILNNLIKSKCIKFVDKKHYKDLPRFSNSYALRIEELFSKLKRTAHHYNRDQALWIDAHLLFTSEILEIPIFTKDKLIRSLIPVTHFDITLPCPFDVSYLRSITLDELMQVSAPVRKIYQTVFKSLQKQAQQIKIYREKIRSFDNGTKKEYQVIFEQSKLIATMEDELQDLKNAEKFWRDAASPKSRNAITWTIVESALALLPFPAPTAPISFLINVLKHKKTTKNLSKKDRDG